jgi:hypothetical protein
MEANLHVSFYFQTFKNHILKFTRKLENFLEVANNVCYKRVKYQQNLIYILGYTKMTN